MEAAEHHEIAGLVLSDRDSASFWETAEEELFLSPPRSCWLGAKGKSSRSGSPRHRSPPLPLLLNKFQMRLQTECVLFPRLIDSQ